MDVVAAAVAGSTSADYDDVVFAVAANEVVVALLIAIAVAVALLLTGMILQQKLIINFI